MAAAMKSRMRGFTLIELMVVLALAAIVMGLAVPSFRSLMAAQRVKAATGDFVGAVTFARSYASLHNTEVSIVAAAGGWQDGWVVTTAAAGVLARQAAFQDLVITSTGPAFTQVVFGPDERLTAAVPGLVIKGADGCPDRFVTFELSGMVKTRKGVCS